MTELVPILGGATAGVLLACAARWSRLAFLPWRVWLPVAGLLGVLATFLTGEWRTSWVFVAFDIPLVAACSAGGFLAVRGWDARPSRQRAAAARRSAGSPPAG